MKTFQEFQAAVEKGRLLSFIRDAIEDHRNSDAYRLAVIADEYDAQRNVTINDAVRRIFSLAGAAVEDFTASNNRIPSNFFRRLNRQRCAYSLGNGVTFDVACPSSPEWRAQMLKICRDGFRHAAHEYILKQQLAETLMNSLINRRFFSQMPAQDISMLITNTISP